MLASAHVLAMDAKNLLDVVDSIRVRYPDLVLPAHLQPQQSQSLSQIVSTTAISSTSTSSSSSSSMAVNPSVTTQIVTQTTFQSVPPHIEENQYQNSTFLHHNSPPPSLLSSSSTGTTSAANENGASAMIYSNQSGIYDNESVINQQIKQLELSQPKAKEIIKPPPPIRSSGLVSKMRANFQQQENRNNSSNNHETMALNEPLKIVEDPNEMYSNAGAIQLPEPVSCKIVQENITVTNQVSGSSAK